MEFQKLKEKYSDLLIDNNFEQLELIRNKPNIFETLGVKNYEIRHSNFLAWLLDPSGNHGLDNYFLKRVLIDVFKDSKSKVNVVDIHKLLKQNVFIHRERHNIDILIEFEDTVIIIENKINAVEGTGQLQKYKEVVSTVYGKKTKIEYVFLSKDGFDSSMPEIYINLSYTNIRDILQDILNYNGDNLNTHTSIYVSDYIDNLNKNIIQMDPANKLAEKIYLNHKELFDFIYSTRPNALEIVRDSINELLINDNFIIGSKAQHFSRFSNQKIINVLPPHRLNKSSWNKGEILLFEFVYNLQDNKIEFKIAISPSNKILNDSIVKILKENYFVVNHDDHWKVLEKTFFEFEFDEFDNLDYIKKKYEEIMMSKGHVIQSLTDLILKNEDLLKPLLANHV